MEIRSFSACFDLPPMKVDFFERRSRQHDWGCVQTDAILLTNNSQHCWMLHVVSVCTPCCMLLNVVACCGAKFETGQTCSPVQTDATLLAYNSQHCWELLRPFVRSLRVGFNFQGGGGGGEEIGDQWKLWENLGSRKILSICHIGS